MILTEQLDNDDGLKYQDSGVMMDVKTMRITIGMLRMVNVKKPRLNTRPHFEQLGGEK